MPAVLDARHRDGGQLRSAGTFVWVNGEDSGCRPAGIMDITG